MEDRVWKKIIDETRGLGIIYRPFLINEPFVDTRMVDIVRYIREDPTAQVEFNTNGALLTPDITEQLIETGVEVMRFSVDGIRRETLAQSRELDYDTVYNNVEYFIEAANRSGKDIRTEVRMIKLPGTEDEQREYRAYWEARNPTAVVFTDLYSYPWDGQTGSLSLPCIKIINQMFFYVDGRATLCCWDASERQIVGDVKAEHVLDIWNGSTLNRCRRLLDEGRRSEIHLCSRCDAYKHFDFDAFFAAQEEKIQETERVYSFA
jgi:MoaA/NifB/PqqE/SkfB family radical SAM enzyme